MQSGGKIPLFRPSPNQNRSESQCSCIFQESFNIGKYAYTGLWVEYALGKNYYVSKIPPVQTKNQIITVSVFLCTLQSTALLSKKFRLLLHCYTLEESEENSPAQGWNNRTLAVHEPVDSRFLVLPGSESTITEITEYTCFSPLRPCHEFKYKSE